MAFRPVKPEDFTGESVESSDTPEQLTSVIEEKIPQKESIFKTIAREGAGVLGAVAAAPFGSEVPVVGNIAAGALGYAGGKQLYDTLAGGETPDWVQNSIVKPAKYIGEGLLGEGMFRGGMKGASAAENALTKGYQSVSKDGLMPTLKKIPGALERGWDSVKGSVHDISKHLPSAQARAGELYRDTTKVLSPEERVIVSKKEAQTAAAKKSLGVSRLPERANPNIRRQALARQRSTANPDVKASEEVLAAPSAEKQANSALDTAIPNVNPKVASFVRGKLQAHNVNAGIEADRTAAQRAESEAGKIIEETKANQVKVADKEKKVADIITSQGQTASEQYPTDGGRYGAQPHGEAVIGAIRGKGAKLAEGLESSGEQRVKEVFNKEYRVYDENPAAVSSSEDFGEELKSLGSRSIEQGNVLKNYAAEGSQIEKRLAQVSETEGGTSAAIPDEMGVAQWRGVKGELYHAAESEKMSGNYSASRELTRLAKLAEDGERRAIRAIGDDSAIEGYKQLSDAYNRVYVEGYRRGYVGTKILKPGGKELGGEAVKPESILPALTTGKGALSNADSLQAALGAERLAKEGRVLSGVSEADVRAAGKDSAKEMVLPWFQNKLAMLYKEAGGGKTGIKKVADYLRRESTGQILDKYGIDMSNIESHIGEYVTQAEKSNALPQISKTHYEAVVSNALKVEDPYQVANYILKSKDPETALKNILSVSNTAEWKNSVQGLVKEELKKRIQDGKRVFEDPNVRLILPKLYQPNQIKTLKRYQTLLQNLDTKNPQTRMDLATGDSVGSAAYTLTSVSPVGMGALYAVKQLIKMQVKGNTTAYEKAVLQYLDDALIYPDKAEAVVSAFEGSKYGKQKLADEINSFAEYLQKGDALNKVLRNIGGATSAAIQETSGKKKTYGQ